MGCRRGECFSLALRRSGTSQRRHPAMKAGGRAGITPLFCSHAHLLPLTPPGTRSDLCRDLASLFTLTHAFPSLLRGNRTKFLVHYKSFSGRPGRRSASSRLLFGSTAELCGAGSDSLSVAAEIAAVVSLNICFLC